eukprot:gene1923-1955_t
MAAIELVLVLLAVAGLLELVARRFGLPHPVLLVLGGAALAVVPGLPRVTLNPDVVFLLFVPPLIYWASLTTAWRDLRRHMLSILLLAFGLVVVTIVGVAVVAHAVVPGLGWPAAFVLGAIVSPTDAVAATSVARRLGLPRRLVTVLEGESLVNDAGALVFYRLAVGWLAAGADPASPVDVGLSLMASAGGGVAIGLVTAWAISWVQRHVATDHRMVQNTISLLTPFAAYLPADRLGASGVLAVVACGLVLARNASTITAPSTRLQAENTWGMLSFVLESLIFILIGLELPHAAEALTSRSWTDLGLAALAVSATVIVVRVVSMVPIATAQRLASRRLRRGEEHPPFREVLFAGWAGVRGGVSLVIALSLPLTGQDDAPLQGRDLIIFLTYGVILATLVLQGLTLAPVARALRLSADGGEAEEERVARHRTAQAGLRQLDAMASDGSGASEMIAQLRDRHSSRLARHAKEGTHARQDDETERATDYRHVRHAMIVAERDEMLRMRDNGHISDHVMRLVQRDLDLEEMLLGTAEPGEGVTAPPAQQMGI